MASAVLISTTSRYKLLGENGSMFLQRRGICCIRASSGSGPLHHSRWRSILLQLFSHEAHIRIDVMKEMLVARAEIVKPILARRRLRKAMLGTLAVAGKTHIALTAISGQRKFLCIAKARLLRRTHQARQMLLHDISQLIVGINEMVARVHIAIVLDCQRASALGRKDAERLRHPVP